MRNPGMRPARHEMLDEDCHGVHGNEPCGRKVTLACRRCGCHRCIHCAVRWSLCPMCEITDPSIQSVTQPN